HQLRAGEARFRAIFDEAGIGIALVALSGRPVESNRALQEWLGYSDAELAGMDLLELTHPDDVSSDWGLLREMLTGVRDSYQVEKRYLRKDGRLVWGRLTVSAVRDQDREPAFLVVMLEDVTAQRRTEERTSALQTLGERLNRATTPKDAARIVLDVADQLLGWDCCWVELVDAEGQHAAGVISMDLLDGVRCEVEAVHNDGVASPFTLQVMDEGAVLRLRKPTTLPDPNDPQNVFFGDLNRPSASLMCVPIRNGARVVGALSIQSYEFDAYDAADVDILQALADYCAGAFERTQAEAARQELQQQLGHSQKMEAIGRLAGGVAHDFNNMLAVINGYSEILLARADTAAASRGPLEEIRRAGQRAASLTRQLLAFSRKEIVQPQVLNLGDVVVDIQQLLQRVIGEDIELVARRSAEDGLVNADPGQIEQVVMNLALNARDAMPRGGTLSLDVSNVYLRGAHAKGGEGAPDGRYVCLTVRDTGCGMSPETMARVFEPFFTTKPMGQGAGLGLATVHGIVKQNRGHIEVESQEGRGAAFRVFLPRVDAPKEAEETEEGVEAECESPLPKGKGTILVVEDEEMLRRMVANLLQSSGYQVLTAMNTDDALLRCDEHPGRIDLLLTDIVMPGRSGRELAVLAAQRYPDLKVIYMSGYMDDDIIRHGVSSAEVHFIQKPFSLVALAQKVQEVLDPD
ncbi:MAG: PAS domain S-box protein, partial [Actinomycetota bacterium]